MGQRGREEEKEVGRHVRHGAQGGSLDTRCFDVKKPQRQVRRVAVRWRRLRFGTKDTHSRGSLLLIGHIL